MKKIEFCILDKTNKLYTKCGFRDFYNIDASQCHFMVDSRKSVIRKKLEYFVKDLESLSLDKMHQL